MSLGLIVAAVGLTGAVGRRLALRERRACFVLACVVGCAGLALCVIGVYQPIFQLAGAIKAE